MTDRNAWAYNADGYLKPGLMSINGRVEHAPTVTAHIQQQVNAVSPHNDPNQHADMFPNAKLSGNISNVPVDAHSQMLAARVEGLEKDINGLQHVWGRVKDIESMLGRIGSIVQPGGGHVYGIRHDHEQLERRVSALENTQMTTDGVLELMANKPAASPDTALALLKRSLNEISPRSLLARDIAEFLRNR